MNQVMIYPSAWSDVAHLPEVKAAIWMAGAEVMAEAEAKLSAHRDGQERHEVVMEKGVTDAHVILQGVAPMSVEFGRGPNEHGKGAMRGLHVLTGSIPHGVK